MVYMVHMAFITCEIWLTCNGTLHCIMHENITLHGVGALLESNTTIGDLGGGAWYHWTKSNKVARLYKMKNLCRVITRRVRHSPG